MRGSIPRLKRRPDFLRVAETRRKWVAPGLILQARRHTSGERFASQAFPFRVGLTVTRKVGNAVDRNRIRRRLRAAVNQVMPRHARGGYDFVVIGRRTTLDRPFTALVGDLEMALRKLEAYRAANGGD